MDKQKDGTWGTCSEGSDCLLKKRVEQMATKGLLRKLSSVSTLINFTVRMAVCLFRSLIS